MQQLLRRALPLCFLVACHGASSSGETPPTTATPEPSLPGSDATPAGQPPDADAPEPTEVRRAMLSEGEAACKAGCDHITACAPDHDANQCADSCRGDLAVRSGAPALQYSGCVRGLDCETIGKSIQMNMGAIGRCYVDAIRMAR